MRAVKKVKLFVGMLVLGCLVTTVSAQDEYELDNSHTSLVFAISHFNLSYTYGRFNSCSGSFQIDGGMANKFNFKIDASSVDTNDAERDKHLRSPDFFNVEEFPEITFESTQIERVDGVYQVQGKLTMLGQTKLITIPIRLVGIGKGPFGKERAGFFAKVALKRSEFGMDKMLSSIGDNIAVTFSFEGIKTKSAKD